MFNKERYVMRELFELIVVLIKEAYADARAYVLRLWDKLRDNK